MPAELVTKPGWLWFALGAAVFAAATTLLGKIGVEAVNSNVATLIRIVVMLVTTAALLSWRGEWRDFAGISSRNWLIIIASGVATGLSWLCYFRALQLAPASRVAPLDKLSVALVLICAFLFLGEAFTWQTALGGALIVAGVLLVSLGSSLAIAQCQRLDRAIEFGVCQGAPPRCGEDRARIVTSASQSLASPRKYVKLNPGVIRHIKGGSRARAFCPYAVCQNRQIGVGLGGNTEQVS